MAGSRVSRMAQRSGGQDGRESRQRQRKKRFIDSCMNNVMCCSGKARGEVGIAFSEACERSESLEKKQPD